jgi:acyl-CoA synthetase (NDP forming)
LALTDFSPETIAGIAPFMPQTGSLHNPVDLTFTKNMQDYFERIPKALLNDPNADGLLIYLILSDPLLRRPLVHMGVPEEAIQTQLDTLIEELVKAIMKLPETSHKPVIGYSFRSHFDRLVRILQNMGFPVLPSPERAAGAMAALGRYGRAREKLAGSRADLSS